MSPPLPHPSVFGNVLSMAATAMGLAKGATTVGVSTTAVAAAVVAMATEVSMATEVATAQPSRHYYRRRRRRPL